MTAMTSKELGITTPAEKAAAARRRDATKRVRWVRDRLTSTTGTPAFDYELLRQFAQNRLSASIAILLLVATVGFLSGLWTGVILAGVWTLGVLGIHGIILAECRRFLTAATVSVDVGRWRTRLVILDLFFGIAWMSNVIAVVRVDEGAGTFILFVMLLVVAVSSMLASSLPLAMFAATAPVTLAVAFDFALRGGMHNYILAAHDADRAGLFHPARPAALFDYASDAGSARRKGRADRRTGTGEGDLRRGAPAAPKPPTSPSRASSRR